MEQRLPGFKRKHQYFGGQFENQKAKIWIGIGRQLFRPQSFGGTLKPTSEIAQSVGAVAAVNAGFFDMKNGGAVDFIKIKGQVFDTSRVYAKQRLPFKQAISAFTIKDNQVKIIKGEQDKGWEDKLDAAYVLLTGPLLLFDKEAQPLAKTAFNDNRHPRTCACVTSDQKLLIVTIDGRAAESEGVSLNELIILLKV
ncbi:MAG: phosphodiester glycosidase family protein [Cytophagaceae bacterium]|nr:phosphodiester glycosidase family protein [Cytophagaceae bacterium]